MVVTSFGVLLLAGWAAVAQVGTFSKSSENNKNVSRGKSVVPAPTHQLAGKTTVEDFEINFLGIADVSNRRMLTTFDMSRMTMNQNFQEFGPNIQLNTFSNGNANSFGSGSASVIAGGSAGGAGGAFSGTSNPPNTGVALHVDTPRSAGEVIVELASEFTWIDGEGNEIETKSLGPTITHFPEFEREYPNGKFLYGHRTTSGEPTIKGLKGQLIVTPGRKLEVEFDGTKAQTKKVGKDVFALKAFQSQGTNGMSVQIQFPSLQQLSNAKTPQDRFQAMIAGQSAHSAELVDSEGEVYPAQGQTNSGGGSGSSFTVTNVNGVQTVQGQAGNMNDSAQTFSFPQLPKGRKVKSIRVGFSDKTGDPKLVDFELKIR